MRYTYKVLQLSGGLRTSGGTVQEFSAEQDLQNKLDHYAKKGWRVVAAWPWTVILEHAVHEQMYSIAAPGSKPTPVFEEQDINPT